MIYIESTHLLEQSENFDKTFCEMEDFVWKLATFILVLTSRQGLFDISDLVL